MRTSNSAVNRKCNGKFSFQYLLVDQVQNTCQVLDYTSVFYFSHILLPTLTPAHMFPRWQASWCVFLSSDKRKEDKIKTKALIFPSQVLFTTNSYLQSFISFTNNTTFLPQRSESHTIQQSKRFKRRPQFFFLNVWFRSQFLVIN